MSAELRLRPDRLGNVPRTGAVESVQEADLRVEEPASSVVSRRFLEWAARTYWRLITRSTLGVIRVVSDGALVRDLADYDRAFGLDDGQVA